MNFPSRHNLSQPPATILHHSVFKPLTAHVMKVRNTNEQLNKKNCVCTSQSFAWGWGDYRAKRHNHFGGLRSPENIVRLMQEGPKCPPQRTVLISLLIAFGTFLHATTIKYCAAWPCRPPPPLSVPLRSFCIYFLLRQTIKYQPFQPTRFNSQQEIKKTNNIPNQQRPHTLPSCTDDAANSLKRQIGAGYGRSGAWGPEK